MNLDGTEKKGASHKVRTCRATRLKEGREEQIDERVAREAVLRIVLNHQEMVALSCTPSDQDYLAAGFLFSEGFLQSRDQIRRIDRAENMVVVHTHPSYKMPQDGKHRGVLTSGCGKGKTFVHWEEIDPLEDIIVDLDFTLTPDEILQVMSEFERRSELFRDTAGVHAAALASRDAIVAFNEDIGRHNAVDKVLGESFIRGVGLEDKFLVTSGRISSDIVSKLLNSGLSLLVSRTAPTSLAVDMAQRLGKTLVGFARGRRLTIYSFPARIKR